MTFHPTVEQTGGVNTYAIGAASVTSGGSVGLVNNSGTGYLYLWVGGTLDVAADQASGTYAGTFSVTVAY